MGTKMQISVFETFKKNAVNIGIDQEQLTRKNTFNEKNLKCFSALGILVISSDLYFFHLASNFREYTESFYITSMSNAVFLVFSVAIWKMEALFQFIDEVKRLSMLSEQHPKTEITQFRHSL